MAAPLTITLADLDRPDHAQAIRALTSAYAADEFGRAQPLSEEVLARLIPGLQATPTALIFLAYIEEEPVGIANCFRGFSTFAARPLVNIHDLAVLPTHRGCGIGRQLLAAVAAHARGLGCCKVTLEVGTHNTHAQTIYRAAGFTHSAADTTAGGSLFFEQLL